MERRARFQFLNITLWDLLIYDSFVNICTNPKSVRVAAANRSWWTQVGRQPASGSFPGAYKYLRDEKIKYMSYIAAFSFRTLCSPLLPMISTNHSANLF